MNREMILHTARQCVCNDRERDYGAPDRSLTVVANLWTAYVNATNTLDKDERPVEITAEEAAVMLALLKVGRIAAGSAKEDNYIDLAGYAAIAGELATGRRTETCCGHLPGELGFSGK